MLAAQVALEEHRSLSGQACSRWAIGGAGTPRRRTRSRHTRSRRCTACRCRGRCTAPCPPEGTRRSIRRSCTGRRSSRGTRSRSRRRRCGCARDARCRRRHVWRSTRARRSCRLYITFSCARRRWMRLSSRQASPHVQFEPRSVPTASRWRTAYSNSRQKKTIAFLGAHVVNCALAVGGFGRRGEGAQAMDFERMLSETRVIPVVEIPRVEDALPLARTLAEGGLACAEITFRTACGRGRDRGDQRGSARVRRRGRDRAVCTPGRGGGRRRCAASSSRRGSTMPSSPLRATAGVPMLPGVCTPSEITACASRREWTS